MVCCLSWVCHELIVKKKDFIKRVMEGDIIYNGIFENDRKDYENVCRFKWLHSIENLNAFKMNDIPQTVYFTLFFFLLVMSL